MAFDIIMFWYIYIYIDIKRKSKTKLAGELTYE